MAQASVMQLQAAQERTPLRVRVRRACYQARSAIFRRRWVIGWDNEREQPCVPAGEATGAST